MRIIAKFYARELSLDRMVFQRDQVKKLWNYVYYYIRILYFPDFRVFLIYFCPRRNTEPENVLAIKRSESVGTTIRYFTVYL